ncbi:MAG: PfkB family carbohydrate kinase [Acidilobaceae archaeon]|nr:PfkB family carbohydrate kinase [Acidilobaceae archaeon]MCX8165876.1 PfkB family carbohydrate kinase [Acidilobaceae archaeon]MDW7974518.1 PfkB family carbohydrate kinase [Sulfolobales archaeon]
MWFLSIGNLNMDLNLFLREYPEAGENVLAEELWIGAGGAATNYSFMIASLGYRVSLIALVSPLAVRLGFLEELRRAGIDASYVRVVEGEPNVAVVLTSRRDSSRTVISYRGSTRGLSGEMVPGGGDHLHFASVRAEVVLRTAVGPRLSSYDPGAEALMDPKGVKEAVSNVNWSFLNERELRALSSEPRDLLRGRNEMVIIKRGPHGAALVTADGKLVEASAPRLGGPVDVTGTGDAFDATFNVAYLKTRDPELSLRAAVVAGALKSLRRGSSNMPKREELLEAYRALYGEELEV